MKLSDANKKYILYFFTIFMPIFAFIFLGFLNNTSIFSLDAIFNTFANDEPGFYRAIKQMRLYGTPMGYNGYEERLTTYLSYGAYHYPTYYIYYILSFITNKYSHNFMYISNIILYILGNLFILIILKPNVKMSLYLLLFNCFNTFALNLIFSGMSEGQHIFAISIIIPLIIVLYKNNNLHKINRYILSTIILLLIMYFGIIRPTMLLFLIYLFFYYVFISNDKLTIRVLFLTFMVVIFCISIIIFYALIKNYSAPYFYNSNNLKFDKILLPYIITFNKSGFIGIFSELAKSNLQHFYSIVMNKGSDKVILLVYCIQFLFLVILLFYKKNTFTDKILILSSIILIISYFEVCMIFYNLWALHRHFLVPIFAMIIVMCFIDKSILKKYFLILFIIISIIFTLHYHYLFKIPNNKMNIKTTATYKEFIELMPKSNDRWDNTVLIDIPPRTDDFMYFLIPNYIGEMCCTNEWLINGIKNNSFKSKYLFISKNSEVYDMAMKYNYEILLDRHNYVLFKIH